MPTISERSIIKFGNGGLVLTIPIGWARYYSLSPGDKLITIANDDLVVKAPHLGRKKKKGASW